MNGFLKKNVVTKVVHNLRIEQSGRSGLEENAASIGQGVDEEDEEVLEFIAKEHHFLR